MERILGTVILFIVLMICAFIIDLLNKRKEEIIKRIGELEYNECMEIAKRIYFLVEQNFRDAVGVSFEKRMYFNSRFKEKKPEIEEKDLDYIRESIVGEMNRERK